VRCVLENLFRSWPALIGGVFEPIRHFVARDPG